MNAQPKIDWNGDPAGEKDDVKVQRSHKSLAVYLTR